MADPIDILNWYRIDERLTTSGQPDEEQLGALADAGVKYVVNLGLHSHERALADEEASVTALGMRYFHLPVDFNAPTQDDFDHFSQILQELNDAPVHVHCILNARVSAFFYRYRRDILGVPEDVARRAMEEIWRPGGVWAAFIGDEGSIDQPHRYKRHDD